MSCLEFNPDLLEFGLALTCEALFLPVVPPVLVLVLLALVLPQLELGHHEECCRDRKYFCGAGTSSKDSGTVTSTPGITMASTITGSTPVK
jgi:hypothetical protein